MRSAANCTPTTVQIHKQAFAKFWTFKWKKPRYLLRDIPSLWIAAWLKKQKQNNSSEVSDGGFLSVSGKENSTGIHTASFQF